jgi:hypothetical protein
MWRGKQGFLALRSECSQGCSGCSIGREHFAAQKKSFEIKTMEKMRFSKMLLLLNIL